MMKRRIMVSLALCMIFVLSGSNFWPPPEWVTVTVHGHIRLHTHDGWGVPNVPVQFSVGSGSGLSYSTTDADGHYGPFSWSMPRGHLETMFIIPGRSSDHSYESPYRFEPESYSFLDYGSGGERQVDFIAHPLSFSFLPLVVRSVR